MILYQMRHKTAFALLAQLDRVTDYESVGQGFESLAAHHKSTMVLIQNHRAFSILVDIYTAI